MGIFFFALPKSPKKRRMSGVPKKGPPKHQNNTAWKPNRDVKKKDKELGGKSHPYPAVSGVCSRCKDKIEWRRKYGKYKPLSEPAKCNQCGKRAVRQAYHSLCLACAKEKNVCAKCCLPTQNIVGRDAEQEEIERKQLEEGLRSLRERDRRSLLRAMEKGCNISDKIKAAKQVEDEEDDEEDDDDEEEEEEEEEEEGGSHVI